jgi:hypothetical protein
MTFDAEHDDGRDDVITPHVAIRPADYPSIRDLRADAVVWPADPPLCLVCGEEMLTEGDLEQSGEREWHAKNDLNPLSADGYPEADAPIAAPRRRATFTVSPLAQDVYRVLGGGRPDGADVRAREALDAAKAARLAREERRKR